MVCSSIRTTVRDTRDCSHQQLPDSNPRQGMKTNMSHSKHSFSLMKRRPCSSAPCLSMYHLHLQELNLMSSWLSSRTFHQICCNMWRSIPDRLQSTDQLWFNIHNGRINSSHFGQVLHPRDSTPSEQLFAEIMGYTQSVLSTPAMGLQQRA